jgi:hypothetical protein
MARTLVQYPSLLGIVVFFAIVFIAVVSTKETLKQLKYLNQRIGRALVLTYRYVVNHDDVVISYYGVTFADFKRIWRESASPLKPKRIPVAEEG